MATTRFVLTASAWTDLGPTPCAVEAVSIGGAYVTATAAPPGPTDAGYPVNANDPDGFSFNVPGLRAYGKAIDTSAIVYVIPTLDLLGGYQTARGYGFYVIDPMTGLATSVRSPGNVIGGYRTVSLARVADEKFMITAVRVVFKSAVTPAIRVTLFSATPGATLADNAAYAISAGDIFSTRRTLSSAVLGAAYESHGTPKTITLTPATPIVTAPIPGSTNIGYYLVDDTGVTLTATDAQVSFAGTGI
jgi:hypothetical protein